MWLSTALATVTGGLAAWALSLAQRTDNIRNSLPDWVSPTTRILIHVARADGHADERELNLIIALLRGQMEKKLERLPKDFETALTEVVLAEIDVIKNGRTLEHDLKEKCFKVPQQQESTAKMAIAIAQADGEVVNAEIHILDQILTAWNFDMNRKGELAADAFNELGQAM